MTKQKTKKTKNKGFEVGQEVYFKNSHLKGTYLGPSEHHPKTHSLCNIKGWTVPRTVKTSDIQTEPDTKLAGLQQQVNSRIEEAINLLEQADHIARQHNFSIHYYESTNSERMFKKVQEFESYLDTAGWLPSTC